MWLRNWVYRVLLPLSFILCSWGVTAHRDIHAAAIAGMPNEVWAFFKKHKKELIEKSVAADRRKHTDSTEAAKHYLDLDLLEYTIEEHGELLQTICAEYNLLSYLFYKIDSVETDDMIRVAADLGHYISDAHVPLHTTSNYNGQFTGQTGIHSLWETHVYELTKPERELKKIKAHYINEYATQIIFESHSLASTVLKKEEEARTRKESGV